MTGRAEMEHAFRQRGFDDGYHGRPKQPPPTDDTLLRSLYLQSYDHGVQARDKDREEAAG